MLQKSHCAGCFFRYCSFAACCLSSSSGCRHRMCAITAGGHFLVRSDNSGIKTSDSGKSPMSMTVTSWKFRSRPREPEPEHYGHLFLVECDSLSHLCGDHTSRTCPEHHVVAQCLLPRDLSPSPERPMAHIVILRT